MRFVDADELREQALIRRIIYPGGMEETIEVITLDNVDAAPTISCEECEHYEDCRIEPELRRVKRVEHLADKPACSYFEKRP